MITINLLKNSLKVCTKCKAFKLLIDFHKCTQNSDGHHCWCKDCTRIYTKSYNDAHREKANARSADWARRNPEKVRAKHLRRIERVGREAENARTKAWRDLNPDKVLAHITKPSTRYRFLVKRHKELSSRAKGVKGTPMSLTQYLRKLCSPDEQERLCYYCHSENPNKHGVGLDRLNNNVTYTFRNTVPACHSCNSWRGSQYTVQETLDHFEPMRRAAAQFQEATT